MTPACATRPPSLSPGRSPKYWGGMALGGGTTAGGHPPSGTGTCPGTCRRGVRLSSAPVLHPPSPPLPTPSRGLSRFCSCCSHRSPYSTERASKVFFALPLRPTLRVEHQAPPPSFVAGVPSQTRVRASEPCPGGRCSIPSPDRGWTPAHHVLEHMAGRQGRQTVLDPCTVGAHPSSSRAASSPPLRRKSESSGMESYCALWACPDSSRGHGTKYRSTAADTAEPGRRVRFFGAAAGELQASRRRSNVALVGQNKRWGDQPPARPPLAHTPHPRPSSTTSSTPPTRMASRPRSTVFHAHSPQHGSDILGSPPVESRPSAQKPEPESGKP